MKKYTLIFAVYLLWGCGSDVISDKKNQTPSQEGAIEVVLFAMNDMHGKIDRFSKVKPFIDQARAVSDKVFLVSAGDIFSGNPIVDFHPEKGSPIVSLMDAVGMDVSVLGNHEFDYGQAILNDRMSEAGFPFICANVSS
ncbi:MAG: 5'-nucleotidase/UDP-sugar diphosphatase, partial [Flavobacteriaceae bacterium]